MNKYVFTHLAAVTVGAVLGFFITKKLLEEEYAKIAQEEIDSVKETFKQRTERADFEEKQTPDAYSTLELRNKSEMAKNSIKLGEQQPDVEVDKSGDDVYVANMIYHNLFESSTEDLDRTKPYLISGEDYEDDTEFEHEKISLYYYLDDDVLADEDDEEVIDDEFRTVKELIGDDWKEEVLESKVAWVRNEPLCGDYEICLVRGEYKNGAAVTIVSDEDFLKHDRNLSPREEHEKRRNNKDE